MNREQAEHILDAYVNLECDGGDNKARISLREVILDAMAYMDKPNTVLPSITLPMNSYPHDWDNTPKVTCTGIDPSFKADTGTVVE